MLLGFITPRLLDIIDILLVAYIFYKVYSLIKGTVAMSIFIGIFSIYLLWIIVKALNMQLLGSIMGQFIGVGVIILIIVFQQEIRKFLIMIGARYFANWQSSIENLLSLNVNTSHQVKIKSIHKACARMAKSKTGALIVIKRKTDLLHFAETGDVLNANTSSRLIESIFIKLGPLHDGAMIIENDRIFAARCVLPVSENFNLPPEYGMRHRAGLGMSENTDAFVIIVSEETGKISIADNGILAHDLDSKALMDLLQLEFGDKTAITV